MHGSRPAIALVFVAMLFQTSAGVDEEGHRQPTPEQMHRLRPQIVELAPIEGDGWILALGGGGESVIGQLEGRRVVAIDISRRELEDAPGEALKVVMDARDLQFLDGTFEVAASFFTLMYIDGADHRRVFDEVHRVLRPGGRFLIWDAVFGDRPNERIRYGVIPLTVKLPDREIATGYGVPWPDARHDLLYYKNLAIEAGFQPLREEARGHWLHLVVSKP